MRAIPIELQRVSIIDDGLDAKLSLSRELQKYGCEFRARNAFLEMIDLGTLIVMKSRATGQLIIHLSGDDHQSWLLVEPTGFRSLWEMRLPVGG